MCGLFFVWKSNRTAIRLIVDARPTNRVFREPPGVALCTAEGLARIEVELPEHMTPGDAEADKALNDITVHLGLADVRDCFHRNRHHQIRKPGFKCQTVRRLHAEWLNRKTFTT